MKEITTDDYIVKYKDDSDTIRRVFEKLMESYYKKYEQFNGEGIHQDDNCLIEASSILADIADNIICFEVNYIEDGD